MVRRVLFAGGGTGGHLFPGIAVAEELQRREEEIEVCFAGSNRPIERKIIERTGFSHHALDMETTASLRRNPLRFVRSLRNACSLAATELRLFDPDVVVGLGGFVSFPFILAAWRQKRRVALLEQNIIAGRATRLGSHLADQICLSFPNTRGRLSRRPEQIVTGNPVRQSIRNIADRNEPARKKLIILGGSQGAVNLNLQVFDAFKQFKSELDGWEIIHQTGERHWEQADAFYNTLDLNVTRAPFFDHPEDVYQNAALAICRAGATTLAELACVGCPAILVPYAYAVADHQTANAQFFESHGAARVVPDSDNPNGTNAQSLKRQNCLADELQALLTNRGQLDGLRQAMKKLGRPEAAVAVADILLP